MGPLSEEEVILHNNILEKRVALLAFTDECQCDSGDVPQHARRHHLSPSLPADTDV